MTMNLHHSHNFLGTITNIGNEGAWMSGDIAISREGEGYLAFFQFMTDDSRNREEPPFAEHLLNPKNWSVEDENGHRRGIEVPAIYLDCTIQWRWA